MDLMKPVFDEQNEILPSLKDFLREDIDFLDRYFGANDEEHPDFRKAGRSWKNVREAAVSFTEIFDEIKDKNGKE